MTFIPQPPGSPTHPSVTLDFASNGSGVIRSSPVGDFFRVNGQLNGRNRYAYIMISGGVPLQLSIEWSGSEWLLLDDQSLVSSSESDVETPDLALNWSENALFGIDSSFRFLPVSTSPPQGYMAVSRDSGKSISYESPLSISSHLGSQTETVMLDDSDDGYHVPTNVGLIFYSSSSVQIEISLASGHSFRYVTVVNNASNNIFITGEINDNGSVSSGFISTFMVNAPTQGMAPNIVKVAEYDTV